MRLVVVGDGYPIDQLVYLCVIRSNLTFYVHCVHFLSALFNISLLIYYNFLCAVRIVLGCVVLSTLRFFRIQVGECIYSNSYSNFYGAPVLLMGCEYVADRRVCACIIDDGF